VAVLLPPRQRAVLILRDVLRWRAAEVADLFGSSVPAVNSSLQRARSALLAADPPAARTGPAEDGQLALVARYLDAFERCDIETLVAVARDDALPVAS
jgi:RNA polymerase sigma-70 factor (ECF subfamily)